MVFRKERKGSFVKWLSSTQFKHTFAIVVSIWIMITLRRQNIYEYLILTLDVRKYSLQYILFAKVESWSNVVKISWRNFCYLTSCVQTRRVKDNKESRECTKALAAKDDRIGLFQLFHSDRSEVSWTTLPDKYFAFVCCKMCVRLNQVRAFFASCAA